MNHLLRRTGVVLAGLCAVPLVTGSARAMTLGDPAHDVAWRVQGGAAQPTAAEKARGDVRSAAYTMGAKKVILKIKVRDWTPCPTSGTCDNQEIRAIFTSADQKRQVTVWTDSYGTNPNLSTYLAWTNSAAGTSGSACEDGQIKRTASNSTDTLTVRVPRSCFKKGWRFVKLATFAIQSYQSGDAYRDGWDFIKPQPINWTPRP